MFDVDLHKPHKRDGFLLASAAEDRTVVVWICEKTKSCHEPSGFLSDWTPLYHLKTQQLSTDSLMFGARVWCVKMNSWGIFAAGEVTKCSVDTFRIARSCVVRGLNPVNR